MRRNKGTIFVVAAFAALAGCRQGEPPAPPTQPGPPGESPVPEQAPAPPEQEPAQPPAQEPGGAQPVPEGQFGYPSERPQGGEQGAGQEQQQLAAAQRLQAFSEDVRELASAPSEPAQTNQALVSALRSLASAMRALPQAPDRIYSAAMAIEAQADDLETSGPKSMAKAEPVRRALREAVAGLEALALQHPRAGLEEHAAMARRAVDAIDASASFEAQRARIIAAFQHVSAALSAAGQM